MWLPRAFRRRSCSARKQRLARGCPRVGLRTPPKPKSQRRSPQAAQSCSIRPPPRPRAFAALLNSSSATDVCIFRPNWVAGGNRVVELKLLRAELNLRDSNQFGYVRLPFTPRLHAGYNSTAPRLSNAVYAYSLPAKLPPLRAYKPVARRSASLIRSCQPGPSS